MSDPQADTRHDQWRSHRGLMFIEHMTDGHLLSAYRTCVREDNPKADDLISYIEERHLEDRIPVGVYTPRSDRMNRERKESFG